MGDGLVHTIPRPIGEVDWSVDGLFSFVTEREAPSVPLVSRFTAGNKKHGRSTFDGYHSIPANREHWLLNFKGTERYVKVWICRSVAVGIPINQTTMPRTTRCRIATKQPVNRTPLPTTPIKPPPPSPPANEKLKKKRSAQRTLTLTQAKRW